MPADRLLIFAKQPVPGRVKTRLTPPLPPAEAAAVYEACLHDVVARAARERASVELWYEEAPGAAAYFAAEFGHVERRAQPTGDLGAKLVGALETSFADDGERVVVIGTDSPTLPDDVLTAAFHDLAEVDVVLGPTRDGGYYMIGIRRAAWPVGRALFRDVPWSSDAVFRTTLERAGSANLPTRVLPGWYDIDRVADLETARRDVRPESRLARWLESHGERYLDG